MATRRKYKQRDPDPVDVAVVDPDPAPLAGPAAMPQTGDPMVRAAEASRHADELQRQHAFRHEI